MKKKAIEKIPFLGLPKVKRGKEVMYAAVTAIKEIGGEPHLLVEVYRNKKACKETPAARLVLTRKDFGMYFPSSGAWSRGKITQTAWGVYGLAWWEERRYESWNVMVQENVLYAPEDLKRIREFAPDVTVWDEKEWWEYLEKRRQDIIENETRERNARKWARRQQALKERMELTPALPEQRILETADDVLFYKKHYLYYKKRGARAVVACSSCGAVTEARWRPGTSYESQLERLIEEPGMNQAGICPSCGAAGIYMPQGRVKSFYRSTRYLFLGQKYKEDGMVFRYIEVEKEWQLEESCGEKGLEMQGACEKLTGIEIARVYFEPGKKIQKDYHKHNPYDGKDFWDDCNLSGLANISIREAYILPETYENLKGSFLQYSAMRQYQEQAGEINPVAYLERYMQTPQIEMLVKMRLTGVVGELVQCRYGIVADEDARQPDTFLGIRKERVKQLIEQEGDTAFLKTMQMEKRMGLNLTDEEVAQITETGIDSGQMTEAMAYMSIRKLLNRIGKYAGCEYGTMCSHAQNRIRQTAQTYFDYLEMRKSMGYDMTNTVYLFPRDLKEAHDRMVREANKKEADKRILEAEEKYPLIKKHYRSLRKRFYFADEAFLIRPARSAGEIVMEGRILHHCVGGDTYLDRHNTGKSIILFLRLLKEPDIPYITVEIEPESAAVRQWYGKHDKKPDEARMQRWINAYVTRLRCAGEAAGGEEEAGQLIPALA